jgi:hypothetical protein
MRNQMTQSGKISPRTKSFINARLDKHLMAYVAAASATGIGMIAAPRSAEGKIVYTPTNVSMVNESLSIDLDNNGKADFVLVEFLCGSRSGCVFANPLVTGNGIKGSRFGAFAGVTVFQSVPKANS